MPKTWTATAVRNVGLCRFVADNGGTITAIEIIGEVNDGENWRPVTLDLWPDLTATQRTQLQAIYIKLKTAYEQRMLA